MEGSAPGETTRRTPRNEQPLTAIQTRAYVDGRCEAEDFPLTEVSTWLERDNAVVWVDLCDATEADLDALADELDLHDLAVEDALEPHQRPKLDHYASHLFLSTHAVSVDREQACLDEVEIDAFIGDRWLLTVRKNPGGVMERVVDRWDRSTDIAAHGVSFLLYCLLDVVVDGYFDAVEAFDEYYDDVSEGIFADEPLAPSQQRNWFEMRRSLVRFHRLVGPMREAISGLMRREHSIVGADLLPYYQDVYDHILRVSESSEALRDLVSTIVETNLSLRDYRQNQVMKKVTSWAAIVAVPTLITGFYGMNVPYPGYGTHAGVLVSSALIVILSAALYFSFRRREWL